ncbi:MAG: signal peptidase I [Nakamurella sp.]
MSEVTQVPGDGNPPEDAADAQDAVDPHTEDAPAAEAAPDAHTQDVLRWRAQSRKRNATSRAAREASGHAMKKRPWWIELPVLVVIAFLATFLIQTFVARVYYVPSASMEPTLHGVQHGGDRILAYKLGYDFGSPHQGDVVVFKGPPTWTPEASLPGPSTWLGKISQTLGAVVGIAPANEKDFVKRVIAVGGQTISCCDIKGRLQVDGVSLTEPYIMMDPDRTQWDWVNGESSCAADPNDATRFLSFRCFGPYTVPVGSVWVMGDHRSDSADSTWNCRGLVPADNVHCQGSIPVSDVVGRAIAIVMPPSRWGGIGSPNIMSGETSHSSQAAPPPNVKPSTTLPSK